MLKAKSIRTSCLAQKGLLIFYYLWRVTRPQLHFGYFREVETDGTLMTRSLWKLLPAWEMNCCPSKNELLENILKSVMNLVTFLSLCNFYLEFHLKASSLAGLPLQKSK